MTYFAKFVRYALQYLMKNYWNIIIKPIETPFSADISYFLVDFAPQRLDLLLLDLDHPHSNIFEYSNEQLDEWGIFECAKTAHSLTTLAKTQSSRSLPPKILDTPGVAAQSIFLRNAACDETNRIGNCLRVHSKQGKGTGRSWSRTRRVCSALFEMVLKSVVTTTH